MIIDNVVVDEFFILYRDRKSQEESALLFNLKNNIERINIKIACLSHSFDSREWDAALTAYNECKDLLIVSYGVYRRNWEDINEQSF